LVVVARPLQYRALSGGGEKKKPNTGCGQSFAGTRIARRQQVDMQSSWQLEVAGEGVLVPAIPATSN